MTRITTLLLEDRAGQWPIAVDWIASLRPARFTHEGRTFDAVGQQPDGTWIYRTADDPPKSSSAQQGEMVRFERGIARCFVGEQQVAAPLPKRLTFQGQRYTLKSRGSDGRPVYWHG